MFEDFKYRITRNWNFIRIARFLLALFVVIAAWKSEEWLFLLIGGALLMQTILNVGCCVGKCSVPIDDKSNLFNENKAVFGKNRK